MATRFQRQQAVRRRTSDITRLTGEYQRSLDDISARQGTAMDAYADLVSQIEGRNTQAMQSFQSQQREFDAGRSAFDSATSQYNEYIKSFLTTKSGEVASVVDWTSGRLPDSQKYFETDFNSLFYLPEGVNRSFFQSQDGTPLGVAKSSNLQFVGAPRGSGYLKLAQADGSFTDKSPDAFTQRTAPTFNMAAPTAPKLEQAQAFDDGEFASARTDAESRLKREIGERKASRLSAMRRGSRTLLSGVKA
jgi:hypothetical protein